MCDLTVPPRTYNPQHSPKYQALMARRRRRRSCLSRHLSSSICVGACVLLLATAPSKVHAFAQREDTGIRSRAAALAVVSASLTQLRGSHTSRTSNRQRRHPRLVAAASDFESRVEDASSSLVAGGDGAPPPSSPTTAQDQERQMYERRAFLSGMLGGTAQVAATTVSATVAIFYSAQAGVVVVEPANAYEQAYPTELRSTIDTDEVENSSNSLTKLKEERVSQKRALLDATKRELHNDPLGIDVFSSSNGNVGETLVGASTWALALWFATGSRSNPVVTPLANVLYSTKEYEENGTVRTQNQWLTDRNDGYFSDLPPTLTALLSVVYIFLGVLIHRVVYFFVADGDADVSLQLGGVCAIGGAVWEVGRLAAKEKPVTRNEYDRDVELYKEFQMFASKRIIVGTSVTCHRSDVISAFRRYNAKYRSSDNAQYPLLDIEIERLLKRWNRESGSGRDMSSAGFFQGITIDGSADVFKSR